MPDVFVRAAPDGSWLVELNPETLPRVLVNQSYYVPVSRAARSDEDQAFLSECLQTANWLTRSLEQRARTILKVATEIVRQQDGFFLHGVAHLRPLNLKTVADAIGMHESTVSRVTSNKSIGTSRGTLRDEVLLHRRDRGRARERTPIRRKPCATASSNSSTASRPRRALGRCHCPEIEARGNRHRPPDGRQVPRVAADPVLGRSPPHQARLDPASSRGPRGVALSAAELIRIPEAASRLVMTFRRPIIGGADRQAGCWPYRRTR